MYSKFLKNQSKAQQHQDKQWQQEVIAEIVIRVPFLSLTSAFLLEKLMSKKCKWLPLWTKTGPDYYQNLEEALLSI